MTREFHSKGITPPQFLYHYTSEAVFLELIKNIKGKKLVFWASSLSFMNDSAEYMASRNRCNDISEEIFMDFDLGEAFGLCFSEKEDIIPMWHMYANQGKGVCIKFDYSDMSNFFHNIKGKGNQTTMFDICKYREINDVSEKSFCDGKLLDSQGLRDEMKHFSFIKPDFFKHEKEWRLMIWESQLQAPNRNIKFREKNGMICPYVEVQIPVSCMREVIVGPCADDKSVDSIRLLLYHSLVHNTIQVSKSRLTLKV